jgi:superfamily II DNA helicase RecQ
MYCHSRGKDFRIDYGNLAVLCATFPNVPVIAMTATATKSDRESIKKILGIKECSEVVGNPDRKNIMYEKRFRVGTDVDCLMKILTPMAQDLLKEQIDYPLTIMYIPLKWCGFAYKIFESVLGSSQYYPTGSMPIPENRLFAQFHSPQTKEIKHEVLKQLCSSQSIIRVVFATVALGMGVDIRGIRSVVHITPPHTIQAYFQETGRAGRDGQPATAILFYNNRDIAKNKPGMQEAVRHFCQSNGECLRTFLLTSLDANKKYVKPVSPKHLCCGVCKLQCDCSSCTA